MPEMEPHDELRQRVKEALRTAGQLPKISGQRHTLAHLMIQLERLQELAESIGGVTLYPYTVIGFWDGDGTRTVTGVVAGHVSVTGGSEYLESGPFAEHVRAATAAQAGGLVEGTTEGDTWG